MRKINKNFSFPYPVFKILAKTYLSSFLHPLARILREFGYMEKDTGQAKS